MPENSYQKPLPAISSLNKPYWDGLRNRELKLQQCDGCANGVVSACAALPGVLVAQIHLDPA